MGQSMESGRPVNLRRMTKRDMRAQFAALCWRRRNGQIDVVMVTTRDTGRWVIPKGWPMEGQTPAQAAATEAFEEAGVVGVPSERCIGIFSYLKGSKSGDLPVIAAVFPVEVTRVLNDWPERKERRRRWMSLKKAAKAASDPELRRLLLDPTLPKLLK